MLLSQGSLMAYATEKWIFLDALGESVTEEETVKDIPGSLFYPNQIQFVHVLTSLRSMWWLIFLSPILKVNMRLLSHLTFCTSLSLSLSSLQPINFPIPLLIIISVSRLNHISLYVVFLQMYDKPLNRKTSHSSYKYTKRYEFELVEIT